VHGVHAGRLDQLDQRGVDRLEQRVGTGLAETAKGFAEMRGRLDQRPATGMQQIVDLLTRDGIDQ